MLMKYYINGEWITPVSNNQMQVINPSNEEVIGAILLATKEDVDRAVQAAKSAFETYSRTTKSERLTLLNKPLEITKDRLGEIAQAISTEMGAPYYDGIKSTGGFCCWAFARIYRSVKDSTGERHTR